MCGTPEYSPPEVLWRQPYTRSFDWWSLGVIICELLCESHLFYLEQSRNNVWDCYVKVQKFARSYPHLDFPVLIDTRGQELLLKLLNPNANLRSGASTVSAKEVTTSSFFADLDWKKLSEQKERAPAV